MGDEGELFSLLIQNGSLTNNELTSLRSQNDHTTAIINGQNRSLELSATYGNITLDGNLADWTINDRLDLLPGTSQTGYELYGKYNSDHYLFAIKSAIDIGLNTTIWLNTDQNTTTGYQIFGFAGGAEYNINIAADGQAYLYTGGAGENLVSKLNYIRSSDGKTIELAIDKNLIGNPNAIDVLADVNDQIFLPGDYSNSKFTITQNTFVPQIKYGNITLDGNINEWGSQDRLDSLPNTQQTGFQFYGKTTDQAYVFAIKSDEITIGQNTTIWLNTDQNKTTGHQIFGFAGGAEYNINIAADGQAYLYTGGAGENLVSKLNYIRSSDGKTIELAVDKNLIGNPQAIDVLADVNDQIFLPGDYTNSKFTLGNNSLPSRTNLSKKVGIVYSETSANQYFDKKAYAHLFTNAQNQAMQAGINFDRLTEADLTDINKLKDFDTLIFPSFRAVNKSQLTAIENTLKDAIYKYQIDIIAAGDFMTVDENGQALGGNPYQRMETLFDIKRSGGGGIVNGTVKITDHTNPILQGYTANQQIIDYTTNGVSFAHFEGASKPAIVLAEQVVNGINYNGVLVTKTGGQNVHFATESLFTDSNLPWQAIQHGIYGEQPKIGLNMTRHSSLFIARNDVDYSSINFSAPLIERRVADTNNPAGGRSTDWDIMRPIYQRFLSLGNEIGTHSYTHPYNTRDLTPEQLEFEFNQSKIKIGQELGIRVTGGAVPGNPENLYVDQELSKYFEYLTGVGSAYTNSFGFLSPDTDVVFFAPNFSFDFNLINFRKLNSQQAEAEWHKEFNQITKNANTPILNLPFHDYGIVEFETGYTQTMFTGLIKKAYDSGTEFTTLDDVQNRIRTFDSAELIVNQVGNTINAKVISNNVGKFGLDINGGNIKSVTNWYAYDNDTVFVAKNGGDYQINLGTNPDNVTRITELPMRAELLSVSGDGQNLSYSFNGEGKVVLNLAIPQGKYVVATGSDNIKLTGNILEMNFAKYGNHTANISFSDTQPVDVAPTVLNPLPNLSFNEDNYVTTIDLSKVFNDFDNDRNLISKSVVRNTNFSLVSTLVRGNDLVLNYTPDRFGSTSITLRGTSNGKTVDHTFSIQVNPVSGNYNLITGSRSFGVDLNDTLNGTTNNDLIRGLGGNDILNGNDGDDRLFGGDVNDTLNGGNGNDILVGGNGNDTLNGGDGNDILIGVYQGVNLAGRNQIDRLTGGAGSDLFVLGDINQVYYNDGNSSSLGLNDYALITDFNSTEDTIQLHGLRSNYLIANSPLGLPTGKAIYHNNNGINELVGIVQGDITNLTLNSDRFIFI